MAGLFGMLALCGLPCLYHPVFNVPEFVRASKDRFFLAIEATDPQFARASRDRFFLAIEATDPKFADARGFLESLNPLSVAEVPE